MARRPRCLKSGKVIYHFHDEAVSAAGYLMTIDYRRTLQLYVYKCPSCRYFHLTKAKNIGVQPEKVTGKT